MTTQPPTASLFVVEPCEGDSAYLFAADRTLGEVAAELAMREGIPGGSLLVKPLVPTTPPATSEPRSRLSVVRS
ncbi:hypothetical protein [Acuticoccus mangrovi]|uniref:Uncharacterized protein n=1 Tax=Acuticoccus mangrovi TaxID=2796142 RepID=A0A934IGR0_9HYPH|nr:hypothetical protein [Acuticoccus mangrovi]MBJ3776389.1 hypothetical protein [Acuticoccus mangrovi]